MLLGARQTLGSTKNANENATWWLSRSQRCATPVQSAIVPWYWFGADINTDASDEDPRDLLKV